MSPPRTLRATRSKAAKSGQANGDDELDPRVQRFLRFVVEMSVRSLMEEQAEAPEASTPPTTAPTSSERHAAGAVHSDDEET